VQQFHRGVVSSYLLGDLGLLALGAGFLKSHDLSLLYHAATPLKRRANSKAMFHVRTVDGAIVSKGDRKEVKSYVLLIWNWLMDKSSLC